MEYEFSIDETTIDTEKKPKLPKFDINKPPKPPKNLKVESKEEKKDKIKDKPFKLPKKKYTLIIVPIINIVVIAIVYFLLIFIFKVSPFWLVLSGFFALPIFLLSVLVLGVKGFLEKRNIESFVIKKLTKNFIVANFFIENKRIMRYARVINEDGKTFNFKGGIYTLDQEAIWRDDRNFPNAFYKENIPNPLKFNFKKYIEQTITKIQQGVNPVITTDNDELIDIVYSSKNLQQFKKEKMLQEFHRNPEQEKLIMILLGLVGASFIAIVLVVIFK